MSNLQYTPNTTPYLVTIPDPDYICSQYSEAIQRFLPATCTNVYDNADGSCYTVNTATDATTRFQILGTIRIQGHGDHERLVVHDPHTEHGYIVDPKGVQRVHTTIGKAQLLKLIELAATSSGIAPTTIPYFELNRFCENIYETWKASL